MIFAKEGDTNLYVAGSSGSGCVWGRWLAIVPTATATFFGIKLTPATIAWSFLLMAWALLSAHHSGQAKDVFGTYTFAFYPTAALAVVGLVLAFALFKPPKKA